MAFGERLKWSGSVLVCYDLILNYIAVGAPEWRPGPRQLVQTTTVNFKSLQVLQRLARIKLCTAPSPVSHSTNTPSLSPRPS